tara:strand:- start:1839 stop:2435 length:597 start_codon:yes stop_codon:yes gene_type:complete
MAKGISKTTSQSGIAVSGLNDTIFGLKELEQGKEVKKALRGLHKEISKEVETQARTSALRQSVSGRPAPKRTQGAKGFVGGGTDRSAFLDIRKTNKFVRNLEFGRDYQFLNFFNRAQGKGNNVSANATGIFFPANQLKRRVYKKWIGNKWRSTGVFPEGAKIHGYVAEPTIAKAVPGITEDYSDRMFDTVKKAIKENK